MNNNKYEKVMPFILDDIIFLFFWVCAISFTITKKFKIISLNIFLLISSVYFVQFLFNICNVIYDIKRNNIVTEKVFISFLKEKKFEGFGFKRYLYLRCNKVKGKRYTGEILELKSKNDLDITEGIFANITYYKKSKIITAVDYNLDE